MNFDEIVNCPKSGGDLCYKTEISKDITNYYSLSCGFWTNTLMLEGSEFYKEQTDILPEIYKDLAWTDPETKLIWLPQTINEPTKGMVFAHGTNAEEWKWAAVKVVPVTEEEKEKYPIPKQPGKYYEYRMDMTTLQHFEERDFMDALSYISLLP